MHSKMTITTTDQNDFFKFLKTFSMISPLSHMCNGDDHVQKETSPLHKATNNTVSLYVTQCC